MRLADYLSRFGIGLISDWSREVCADDERQQESRLLWAWLATEMGGYRAIGVLR